MTNDIEALVKEGLLVKRYDDSGNFLGVSITKEGIEHVETTFPNDEEVLEVKEKKDKRYGQ